MSETEVRIDEIKERLGKTTAGIWNANGDNPGDIFVEPVEGIAIDIGHMTGSGDAQFVAHAKEDIKFLLDQLTGGKNGEVEIEVPTRPKQSRPKKESPAPEEAESA